MKALIRTSLIVFTICSFAFASLQARADGAEDAAIDSAKRAALIQTGLQSRIDQVNNYAEATLKHYIEKAGLTKPIGIILYTRKVLRDQSITVPIIHSRTEANLTVGPNILRVDVRYELPRM